MKKFLLILPVLFMFGCTNNQPEGYEDYTYWGNNTYQHTACVDNKVVRIIIEQGNDKQWFQRVEDTPYDCVPLPIPSHQL